MSQDVAEIKEFQGVNRSDSARDIADNEFVSTQNMYPVSGNTELGLRPNTAPYPIFPSFWRISEDVGGGLPQVAAAATYQFKDRFENNRVILWVSGYRWVAGGGTAREVESRLYEFATNGIEGFFSLLWEGMGLTPPQGLSHRGKLYLYSREAGVLKLYTEQYMDVYGKPAVKVSQELRSVLSGGGGVYRDSLVYCDLDDPHMIRFSDPLEEAPISLDKSLRVGISTDDRTMTAVEVGIEGGGQYIEPYLLVFKSQSVWTLNGPPPTSVTLGGLTVSPLIRGEGLISKATVVRTKLGVLWCSGKNVWFTPNGKTPVPIGGKIAKMLKDLPREEALWSAAFHDGFYKLTVPAPGVAEGPDGQYTQTEQWWCDLRNWGGDSLPTWWGPMTVSTMSMMVEDLPGDETRLVGTTAILSTSEEGILSTDIKLWEMGDRYVGNDFDGTPVEGELRFKEFDFGAPKLNKTIDVVEVEARVEVPSYITDVEMIANGGFKARDAFTNAQPAATGFVLDTSVME